MDDEQHDGEDTRTHDVITVPRARRPADLRPRARGVTV
jgi:hypothetical protein